MKTFVIGDIHGGYKALKQCLERSKFDYDNDKLITLGDICDGWGETVECVDELLKIKNRIDIRGNHDVWLKEWFQHGTTPNIWLDQGGKATVTSYMKSNKMLDETHHNFFKDQVDYYLDDNNRLFVHGGLNWHTDLSKNLPHTFHWDRNAFYTAQMWEKHNLKNPDNPNKFKDYNEVYVGHTATNFGKEATTEPLKVTNMWNMDQGGGYKGKLSIMNINTKEYFQSDLLDELYPNEEGR